MSGSIATAQDASISSPEKESQTVSQLKRSHEKPLMLRDEGVTRQAQITFISQSANYPIFVDGQPMGETSPKGHTLTLPAGKHIFEVRFSETSRWSKQLSLSASKPNCSVLLDYQKATAQSPKGIVTGSFIDCEGILTRGSRCTRLAIRDCYKSFWCAFPPFFRVRPCQTVCR
jgi:hypothetical protein